MDVLGRSAHIARAEEGLDALEAGAEFYLRALDMERKMPKEVFRLLKFGKFESGRVCNAISDHTHMEGSLRAFQDEIFYGMRQSLLDIAARVEQESGCRVQVDMNEGYPAVMNPPGAVSAGEAGGVPAGAGCPHDDYRGFFLVSAIPAGAVFPAGSGGCTGAPFG